MSCQKTMKRRQFVDRCFTQVAGVSTVAAGSLAMIGCDSEHAVEPSPNTSSNSPRIQWKLITSWPKFFPGLGQAPENLAKQVADMTGGAFQIQVYGAGELVPALEVFDAVSQGTVAMGHSSAYYWKGKLPAAPFFTAVPFGLTAQEMNGWLHFGGGLSLWRSLYKPFNLLPFPGGNTGVQMAGWFNKPIERLADIKGMKMRIPGLAGEVWRNLGGVPVTLAGSELFTALQTGAIDATEWVGPYNDLAFGLHKAAKYYYYPGWHEPGATLEFIINQKAYDALPKHYQQILATATQAVNQQMLDEYTARNHAALEELINEHGVDVRALPVAVLKALKTASEKVVAQVAEKNDLASRIYQSYLSFQRHSHAYHNLSEFAYMQARSG